MAVNMKLGVDLGSFNTGINQAKAQIKTFDAALKQAESQFKATGDAESAMTTKMSALSSKLSAQKKIVDDYRRALETMTKNNVDPLSTAFQKMQKEMLLAESAMYDTQSALNELSSSEQKAAQGADALTNSVNSIGKKISLDQVINGIGKITDGLENAGKKALQLGEQIFSAVMDKARWADDSQTMALMYGIPLERFLQMQKLVQNGLDTSVDAILGAQSKLAKGIGGENKAAMQALKDLGVSLKTLEDTGDGILEFVDKDPEETFFEIGRALMEMGKAYDKEAAAQALFGRSWRDLVPLFDKYKTLEEYNAALEDTKTASEEDVNALAELNDKVDKLKGNLDTLSTDILATLAPALSEGADALNGVLSTILEYLQKPEGQEMLNKLGESISGLFTDLSKVNPEDVVNNFVTVFNKLTSALEFIKNNWSEIVDGIKAIGVAFGALKIGEGVLEGLRLINGFKTLNGDGGGDQTQTTGGKKTGLWSKLAGGVGAMIVVNYDPLTALEYKREYGAREGSARYIDSVMGSNLTELMEEWDSKKTQNSGDSFLQQVMDSPKNLAKVVWEAMTGKGKAGDWSGENGDDWSVKVKPEAEEGSAEALAEQIGAVTVPVNLRVNMGGGAFGGGGGGIMDQMADALFASFRPGYANGIPWINNTQLALLHRGERVLTASENKSYTFNNNTYFGSVNLNNGTQVEQLSEAIARNNRKQASAYGA